MTRTQARQPYIEYIAVEFVTFEFPSLMRSTCMQQSFQHEIGRKLDPIETLALNIFIGTIYILTRKNFKLFSTPHFGGLLSKASHGIVVQLAVK